MTATPIINHLSWTIGGPQGTGVDSSANLLLRSCAMAGLFCYGKREYHSTIKTGHSYTQVRVSATPIASHVDPVHLLTTYEKTAAKIHAEEVVSGGAIIFDPAVISAEELNCQEGVLKMAVPYDEILDKLAEEMGQPAAKVKIMKNTLAVGATLAMVNFDIAYIEKALQSTFKGRKAKLVPDNMLAVKKGYEYVQTLQINGQNVVEQFGYRLEAQPNTPPQMIMSGTTAVALGKLKAGCRMQTYYPITPASDESVYLESQQKQYGINVVQCEDEIASVCMAVGSALTGTRSATSSSCPGFGLKAEGIGWAAINEVPVVIHDYQRGGPSTGLPTRHEQGDLLSAVFISHGNPPRMVVAPSDMSEYFEDTFHAFNYADQYQTPVIVLTDKCIGNNTMTISPFNEAGLKINRGKLATQDELDRLASLKPELKGQFPRFEDSADGISPRPTLGMPNGLYWNTGDERDIYGHITEDPENRQVMMNKRFRKLQTALSEIPESQQFQLYGSPSATTTILTWGSTKGPILDAMPQLLSDGFDFNVLVVRLMSPFPAQGVARILSQAKTKIGFEMNHTAQLAQLTRMETGIAMDHQVTKFTGRPISETEAASAIREILSATPSSNKEVVLSYGK
ncbi:MAG: 2-oxoacid:acceptor oxidoreductase subunit alpha [Vampirovibrionales bacterium]